MSRPPLPPFTLESAIQKVRFAYEGPVLVSIAAEPRALGGAPLDPEGLMHTRIASINDLAIAESERLYRWPAGRRPNDHPGLSELGL